ncbi:type VII secretion-associated serine protease mycosin [Micromonospora wenchangensis]|uniref:Type VII secretion-associated serine protease mycosin n=1 Tax=Micromonospora wenchangensis TaxID=1185415 RepID=A0A246RN70_9ACTN|nr:type VII secretion-associated serine protease mycosin [Micromonospora wenchangensis]
MSRISIITLAAVATFGASLPHTYFPSDSSDRIRADQWHLRYLKTTEAQSISQGEGIVVALPDTGVSPHPDLSDNLLPGVDLVTGEGVGHRDRDGHGTGMAGLIAAHGKGRKGALGVAPKAKILPIYVSPEGESTANTMAAGIEFAARQGAKVICISSGGPANDRLRAAVKTALQADVVIVAAAGNTPDDSTVTYPAAVDGVLAVGGIGRDGKHAPISVSGPEIDVVAPAVDIYSTSINGRYRKGTGTSDATAIVAGAAALVRSKYPYLPAAEVIHRLTATAVDKGPPGRDDEYGYGVIDLVAALTADVPPLGFEGATATPPGGATSAAQPAGADGDGGAAVRGWVTLGVIVAAGGGFLVWRRHRRADDPPPRISR